MTRADTLASMAPPPGMTARLQRHPGTALTPDEIDWLVEARWVNEWEEDFLRDTAHPTAGNFARRIAPTPNQLAVQLRINARALTLEDQP